MLTIDQLRSIRIDDPADQQIAHDHLRESGNVMEELETAFDKFGAKAATKMLTACMANSDESNEYHRLSAGLMAAAYGHVLRLQRKQAN